MREKLVEFTSFKISMFFITVQVSQITKEKGEKKRIKTKMKVVWHSILLFLITEQ